MSGAADRSHHGSEGLIGAYPLPFTPIDELLPPPPPPGIDLAPENSMEGTSETMLGGDEKQAMEFSDHEDDAIDQINQFLNEDGNSTAVLNSEATLENTQGSQVLLDTREIEMGMASLLCEVLPVDPTAAEAEPYTVSVGEARAINRHFNQLYEKIEQLSSEVKSLKMPVCHPGPDVGDVAKAPSNNNAAPLGNSQPIPSLMDLNPPKPKPPTPTELRAAFSASVVKQMKNPIVWGDWSRPYIISFKKHLPKWKLAQLVLKTKAFTRSPQILHDISYTVMLQALCLWYTHMQARKLSTVPPAFPKQYAENKFTTNQLVERVLWLEPRFYQTFLKFTQINHNSRAIQDNVSQELVLAGIQIHQSPNPMAKNLPPPSASSARGGSASSFRGGRGRGKVGFNSRGR